MAALVPTRAVLAAEDHHHENQYHQDEEDDGEHLHPTGRTGGRFACAFDSYVIAGVRLGLWIRHARVPLGGVIAH